MLRYAPEVGFAVPEAQRDLDRAARRDLDNVISDDDIRDLRVVRVPESATSAIVSYAKAQMVD